jgi:hypothetical protein
MFGAGFLLKMSLFVVSENNRQRTVLWQIPAWGWKQNHTKYFKKMTEYLVSTHSLQFHPDHTLLNVVRDGQILETFKLNGNSLLVSVENEHYRVTSVDPLSDADKPHKYDIDGGATVTFNQGRLGGVGIIDLRDMGRVGNFTVEYLLNCGGVRLALHRGPFALWVKPLSPKCYSFDEN